MSDTHIKINAVTPRVQYTGNGVTTTFPYEFAIFDETDMVVYVGDDIIESGYTVTGAGETEGGTVVFDTAPANGVKITLLRDVPIERITDFQEGGTFRPKNLNDEFDRQTAFIQQVQEKLDRTLILPPTTEIDPSQILGEVDRIYDSIDNIDTVADNETNINAVASNQTNINTCASNIAAIVDAPNQAAAAASSAQDAASSAASLDVTNIAHKNEDNTFIKTNTYIAQNDYGTSVAFRMYNNTNAQNGIRFSNTQAFKIGEVVGGINNQDTCYSVIRAYFPGIDGFAEFKVIKDAINGDGVSASSGVKKDIIEWCMPSDTFINLSFAKTAVGKYEYTAPANGYLVINFTASQSGGSVILTSDSNTPSSDNILQQVSSSGHRGTIFYPMKKDKTVYLQVSVNSLNTLFNQRFYYADGEV